MKKSKKWQILNSQMVINHPWCQVRQDEIELPNGKIIDDYFVYLKPEIALILPITSNQEIVFVRQYRHAVGEFFMELPAGNFNPKQETAATAAQRELLEETGYLAENLRAIATLYDKPSKDTNQIHLFLAENVVKTSQQNLDITEDIEIVLVPKNQIIQKIQQGEISVAGTVAALFLGLNLLVSGE
ncbi:NUDIX hydrolase [Calothrix sp. 336/3]|uniref:NUDIX hydrolase n=1 Tax=Calothrix sp. 336/3 TaxID=1337936 RepID=UPI0004E36FE7|nr:NUDIX hydrolase [Calothrix sp. 336/3]AKG23839.1 NUDIX hydrolase [Calothrix sp. 336/3]